MKFVTRTIIVLVVINLMIGNFALAQNAPSEGNAETAEPVARSRVRAPGRPEPVQPGAAPPVSTPVGPTPPTASGPGEMIISGNTGLSGVMMFGLPSNIVTDQNGYYMSKIPYGWRGRVKPVKEGYAFKPSYKNYGTINSHQNNQNYAATKITFTISGRTGIGSVMMQGLPSIVVTDPRGYYSASVPSGWTGTVRPKKDSLTFEPPELRYSRVMHALTNQDYIAKKFSPPIMFGRTGSRKVLVIPSIDVKAEDLAAITEDLQVMSHIFDERFKEPQEIKGVFVDFGDFFGRDSRSTEAIYMQGYGVLFLMEVNFAFSPAPKPQEQEAQETEEYVDPDWQRAKQKLFSPKGFGGSDLVPEEQYNAQQIDQIKTELIRTLKHTANIRTRGSDEWIILTVIGQSRQPGGMYEDYYRSADPWSGTSRSRGRSSSSSRGSYGGGYSEMYGGVMMGGGMGGGMMGGGTSGDMMGGMEYGETGSASTTVLTIRAKKTDVDAFAIGELDFEEFQQKVDIFTY